MLSIQGIVYDSLETIASPGWIREVGFLKKASGFAFSASAMRHLVADAIYAMREAFMFMRNDPYACVSRKSGNLRDARGFDSSDQEEGV